MEIKVNTKKTEILPGKLPGRHKLKSSPLDTPGESFYFKFLD